MALTRRAWIISGSSVENRYCSYRLDGCRRGLKGVGELVDWVEKTVGFSKPWKGGIEGEMDWIVCVCDSYYLVHQWGLSPSSQRLSRVAAWRRIGLNPKIGSARCVGPRYMIPQDISRLEAFGASLLFPIVLVDAEVARLSPWTFFCLGLGLILLT